MLQLTIILLILGAGLLVAEMFVPGFGFLGISGIIVSIVSMILTALFVPGGGFVVIGELAVFALLIYLIFRLMKKNQALSKLILSETLNEDTPEIVNYDYFLGKEGMTVTSLRPLGDVDFNGQTVSAFSEGNYIPENCKVKVVRVEGSRVVVAKTGN